MSSEQSSRSAQSNYVTPNGLGVANDQNQSQTQAQNQSKLRSYYKIKLPSSGKEFILKKLNTRLLPNNVDSAYKQRVFKKKPVTLKDDGAYDPILVNSPTSLKGTKKQINPLPGSQTEKIATGLKPGDQDFNLYEFNMQQIKESDAYYRVVYNRWPARSISDYDLMNDQRPSQVE